MRNNQPIELAEEFVLRAGVANEFFVQSLRVENSLRERNYSKARLQLYTLFLSLAQGNETDIKQEPNGNVLSFVFWTNKAGQLFKGSPLDAFRLAVNCISAIEEFLFSSENVQICAFSAVLGSAEAVLSQAPSTRDSVCDALKNVMMRSSEFVACSLTRDIFDLAADKFLKVLKHYSPSERYNHISEMSVWLGTRKIESPYLQAFVDDMLSIAEEYENGEKYIPDEPPEEKAICTSPANHLRLVYSAPS